MFLRMRRRWRWVVGSGVICLAGAWAYRTWADPWPARVTLGSAEGEVPLAFSPDGDRFATSYGFGIALWDCRTGQRRATWANLGGVAVAGAYSLDGATFAAIVRENNVPARLVLIDVATGRVRATTPTRHDRDAGLAYSADGSAIVLGSADGNGFQEVVVFDPASGREVAATRPAPPIAGDAVGIAADVGTLAYFPPQGGPITLDRVGPTSPARLPLVAPSTVAPATGAFDRSSDGRLCAIGRLDGTIAIHELAAGRLVAKFPAHSGPYASADLRFAPDGRTLVSRATELNPLPNTFVTDLMRSFADLRDGLNRFGRREDLVVLDVATGRIMTRSADARQLYFSPDGRTVATRDRDGRIHLRDRPRP